jgi:integrase
MLATGVRLGSALALKVQDIDLARREITLRSTKGDRPESPPIGKAIRDHLTRYLAGHGHDPLFARAMATH